MTDTYNTKIVAFGPTIDAHMLGEFLRTEMGGFSFDRFIPQPKLGALASAADQQEWRIQNWGTRCDCTDASVHRYTGKDQVIVTISYDCTSGTSLPVSMKLAELYPNLQFIQKYQTDPNGLVSRFSTLNAQEGINDVFEERWVMVGLDFCLDYEGDEQFLISWGRSKAICNVMMFLDCGEDERLNATPTLTLHHAGNLALETA